MIRMPDALAAKQLKARMLLQVHDELIFEAPEKEAEKTAGRQISDGESGAPGGRTLRAAGGRGARRAELGRRALTALHGAASSRYSNSTRSELFHPVRAWRFSKDRPRRSKPDLAG